jgi:hypothetical protein
MLGLPLILLSPSPRWKDEVEITMWKSLNPNTVYYLLIYAIIVISRYFKMYGQVKSGRADWRYYWFISLEFVYSTAGVVILLITRAPTWVSAIVLGYVLLLLASAFIDAMGDSFTEWRRFCWNLVIVTIVLVFSVAFNQTVLKPLPSGPPPASRDYMVAIPYRDATMANLRLGDRETVYVATVSARSSEEAIKFGVDKFWQGVTPYNTNAKHPVNPKNVLFPDIGMIVASAPAY